MFFNYTQPFEVGTNVFTDCGCYAMDYSDQEHYVEAGCAGIVVEVGSDYTLVDFGGHRIAMFDAPVENLTRKIG